MLKIPTFISGVLATGRLTSIENQCFTSSQNLRERRVFIPQQLQLSYAVKYVIEQSTAAIISFHEEHGKIQIQYRCSFQRPELLSNIIKPIIQRRRRAISNL
ncbi:hypothetical protein BCV71DRAFT_268061 [Rhizopus microsporus]|uniref:Uncharacterized protein n=1 Tax=Rhizopus microsporus TaxID=58291 RepID=A0A1X0RP01_RHIZD|nr:hypothetical protein BCV71DRAFT_268061 [Rhizopus microsporus]